MARKSADRTKGVKVDDKKDATSMSPAGGESNPPHNG